MEYLFLGLLIGILIGTNIASKPDSTKAEEKLIDDNKKLVDDVAYYKKQCKRLSEENMEFRRKQ